LPALPALPALLLPLRGMLRSFRIRRHSCRRGPAEVSRVRCKHPVGQCLRPLVQVRNQQG
jgi:hypothetical protein